MSLAPVNPADINARYETRGRYFFTDDTSVLAAPHLIEMQTQSYQDFLDRRLRQAFEEVFPIYDFSKEKIEIGFRDLFIDKPKYTVAECKRKNLNYEAGLKVRFEMLNKQTGEIKEQDVYMGGVPLMTEDGTFIVNGIERVIVHQVVRSTGMFFTPDSRTPGFFGMKVIPQKGSWFEVEIEKKGIVNVKIDKKRKIPFTVLLRAFGLESDSAIIDTFKKKEIIAKYISPTIEKDKTKTQMEAMKDIYKLLRPGDLGTEDRVKELFDTTFFDRKKFDLGAVARMKMNRKLGTKTPYGEEGRFLSINDLTEGLKYLFGLMEHQDNYEWDDIDHLENRRVRSVGELVMDKLRVGLARMEKIARDRMTIIDLADATPGSFINSRPVIAVMKEFFGTSQLSQFMDQSNPVSEIAHKRRITALGPGGLTRERASFEVRDVHPTQYGRICPIATPE